MHWDGQTLITAFRDHMKALHTCLAAAGLNITAQQFYQYFINSLPAEYDLVIAVHIPTTSNYSVNVLCDAFHTIELCKELHTSMTGSTSEDQVGLLAKQKGSKGSRKAESGRGSGSTGSKGKKLNVTCYGCGKKGHYKHECWSAKKGGDKGSSNAATTSGTNASSSGHTAMNKSTPAKPAGGVLLCLMESSEVAYSMNTDGRAQYYLNTGASSHFIEELGALHSYIPFEVPQSITTAKSGTIRALGSGTLKFATYINGKEMTSELQNVYYIPNIHHWLISIGKLFAQGAAPQSQWLHTL